MVKLSDRLERMAECVKPGETAADIGTDHGLLPIFLYETKRSPRLILCDVNSGPLKKAEENVIRFLGEELIGKAFFLRLGDGLAPLEVGEAQAAIIAGMGGILISDILQADPEKARSFSRLILQPRNHCPELRKWLRDHKFEIYHEFLVREGIYICEVICARPQVNLGLSEPSLDGGELEFEISPIWIRQNDPLLEEFLCRKIAVEQKIIENIREGASFRGKQGSTGRSDSREHRPPREEKLQMALGRLELFTSLAQDIRERGEGR